MLRDRLPPSVDDRFPLVPMTGIVGWLLWRFPRARPDWKYCPGSRGR